MTTTLSQVLQTAAWFLGVIEFILTVYALLLKSAAHGQPRRGDAVGADHA